MPSSIERISVRHNSPVAENGAAHDASRILTAVLRRTGSLLPGLVFAAMLAWLSIWLSDAIGVHLLGYEKTPVSPVMTAILLGLIISNVVQLPDWLAPGLSYAVKKALRLGIILLGIRLSVVEVFRLGALGVPIVFGCVVAALFFTVLLARAVKLPEKLGILIAVGTSICGVSAIVAAGPAIESSEEEMAYAVSVITVFGLLATIVYPYLANFVFAGDAVRAGLFLGTSIHDTSQVTGAALLFADVFSRPEALNVAVVTKLIRNIFMVFMIPGVAYYYARRPRDTGNAQTADSRKDLRVARFFPLFIIAFVILALVRTVGDVTMNQVGSAYGMMTPASWFRLHGFLHTWAVRLLVLALAAVGLTTQFSKLKRLGVKPFVTGLAAALIVGLVSLVLIASLAQFITAI